MPSLAAPTRKGPERSGCKLVGVLAILVVATGCQPDVLIASSENTGGVGGMSGAAGTGAAAGTGIGAGTGGMGEPGKGGEGGAPPEAEAPRLLADSVADFSLNQGERGWWYGFDSGSLDTFEQLKQTGIISEYMPVSNDMWECWTNAPYWTQIFQLGAHPNGLNTSTPSKALLQRAVRRWVSTFAGDVIISGEIAKIDVTVNGSNGIEASVYVDGGLPIYSKTVGGEDAGGLSYDVVATLQVGSNVDFVLDPRDSDDHHDLTRFTSVIARVEP